ncbi:MAG: hypothetical protein Salg2KO_00240 [Salibacteraceae bacterium]
MKKAPLFIILIVAAASCHDIGEDLKIEEINWKQRSIDISKNSEDLEKRKTYLSVYSEIYERNQHRTYKLTATVSIRNTSETDTVYLFRADYYNTTGEERVKYLDLPVYITPMETVELVIDQTEIEGETGGNFIFEWAKKHDVSDPFFESVMISTSGQQGISFTSQGVDI